LIGVPLYESFSQEVLDSGRSRKYAESLSDVPEGSSDSQAVHLFLFFGSVENAIVLFVLLPFLNQLLELLRILFTEVVELSGIFLDME
jgi:hypothetical protein